MALKVKFAVFGALAEGSATASKAADVKGPLQTQIDERAGVVKISVQNLSDPCPNNPKHFAAIVERDGTDYYFACQEDQTINFDTGGSFPLKVKWAVFGALADGSATASKAADVTGPLQTQIDERAEVVKISVQESFRPMPKQS